MAFSVTILGSSSALPTIERNPTAHLVNHDERFFLIDCGEGTQVQLRRFKQPMNRINHIFISHLHGDHVFGLFGLLSTFSLLGRRNDLHIYCPPLLREILNSHLEYFEQDMHYKIVYHLYSHKESSVVYEDKKLTVSTIPLKHRIPCVGFIFREKMKDRNIRKDKIAAYKIGVADIVKIKKGQDYETEKGIVIANEELTTSPPRPLSYAFCTDTRYSKSFGTLLEGVDLLYYESTFLHNEEKLAKETYHSTSKQAAKVARDANVAKLIIGHFSSRYRDAGLFVKEAREVFPNTFLANDGDYFVVGGK